MGEARGPVTVRKARPLSRLPSLPLRASASTIRQSCGGLPSLAPRARLHAGGSHGSPSFLGPVAALLAPRLLQRRSRRGRVPGARRLRARACCVRPAHGGPGTRDRLRPRPHPRGAARHAGRHRRPRRRGAPRRSRRHQDQPHRRHLFRAARRFLSHRELPDPSGGRARGG